MVTENISNFTSMVYANLNDPNCALSVGAIFGAYTLTKFLFLMVCAYIALRFIEKLALEPSLEWMKGKLWKRK